MSTKNCQIQPTVQVRDENLRDTISDFIRYLNLKENNGKLLDTIDTRSIPSISHSLVAYVRRFGRGRKLLFTTLLIAFSTCGFGQLRKADSVIFYSQKDLLANDTAKVAFDIVVDSNGKTASAVYQLKGSMTAIHLGAANLMALGSDEKLTLQKFYFYVLQKDDRVREIKWQATVHWQYGEATSIFSVLCSSIGF